jgi:hypothetical protein
MKSNTMGTAALIFSAFFLPFDQACNSAIPFSGDYSCGTYE